MSALAGGAVRAASIDRVVVTFPTSHPLPPCTMGVHEQLAKFEKGELLSKRPAAGLLAPAPAPLGLQKPSLPPRTPAPKPTAPPPAAPAPASACPAPASEMEGTWTAPNVAAGGASSTVRFNLSSCDHVPEVVSKSNTIACESSCGSAYQSVDDSCRSDHLSELDSEHSFATSVGTSASAAMSSVDVAAQQELAEMKKTIDLFVLGGDVSGGQARLPAPAEARDHGPSTALRSHQPQCLHCCLHRRRARTQRLP